MRTIDLDERERGSLCGICGEADGHALAELHHRELGPVCHDCFAALLRGERALREAAKMMEVQP